MPLTSTNPATGQVLSTFDELTPEQLETKVACAAAAFATWRRTSFAERSAVLRRAAEILHADKEKLARLAVLEMGKTRKSAIAEVEKCVLGCRF
jgi:succinate-semialdehyde dehydrogenase/glutarate-semialdehyde dehydrogenase